MNGGRVQRQMAGDGSRARRAAAGVVACVALAWLAATGAHAHEPAEPSLPTSIRCEAEGPGRVYCPLDTRHGVELVRQLSESPCIRESDWGQDAAGVWVARGCRAEFHARAAQATVTRRMIRCESGRGQIESCAVTLRGAPVRLLRQMSALPCRRDESWGVGRNQVWVSRGCKGEFEIGERDGSFPPGPRLVTCESKGHGKRTCGTTVGDGVSLVRQLSGMDCEEGRNWGWDADGVWVNDGCRAEFAVQ